MTTQSTEQRRLPNLVISASAGAGKTFQLSTRYLELLLSGVPCDRILATTFTRKAAGEILQRVVTRLAQAALSDEDRQQLADEVGRPRLQQARVHEVLQHLLSHLHRAQVQTLDSFFIEVARSFSLELGLAPGWQIVSTHQQQRLHSDAVASLLDEETPSDLHQLLRLMFKGQSRRAVTEEVHEAVAGLYDLFRESSATAWQQVRRDKRPEPVSVRSALQTLSQTKVATKRMQQALELNLQHFRAEDWESFLDKGLAPKMVDGTAIYNRSPIPAEVVEAYAPLIAHVKAVLSQRLAVQTQSLYQLLQRFARQYERLKWVHRAYEFTDITRKLEGIGDVSALSYRLDCQIDHLLLDEFQDTAPLQWRVLYGLARRVAGSTGMTSFFCVGDVKQAIYGWRGGSAQLLEELPQQLPNITTRQLNRSYRSSPAVIEAVNRLFQNLLSHDNLKRCQRAAEHWQRTFLTHETTRTGLPGVVTLEAAAESDSSEEEANWVATVRAAARRVQSIVRETPGRDVGVLVRRNDAVARMISELTRLGVPASQEGGRPITDSAAVQLVLSRLRLADHPGDSVAYFHLARSPWNQHLSLADPEHGDRRSAWQQSLADRQTLADHGFGSTLQQWSDELQYFCNQREWQRLNQMVQLGYRYQAMVENPQQVGFSCQQRQTLRLDDFIDFVASQPLSDPSAQAVRVMTVHQAKGLEFDIVVATDLDQKLIGSTPAAVVERPHPASPPAMVCAYPDTATRQVLSDRFDQLVETWNDQQAHEALCVLYVMLTRARYALHAVIAAAARQNTLPETAAGLLTAAWAGGQRLAPGAMRVVTGRIDWYRRAPEPGIVRHAVAKDRKVVRDRQDAGAWDPRAGEAGKRHRPPSAGARLEAASPSSLEGGKCVTLDDLLRLPPHESLEYGTLIHAWFEQIEWLDLPLPDEQQFRQVARQLLIAPDRIDRAWYEFRQMIARPAIAHLLSRNRYRDEKTSPFGADVVAALRANALRLDVHRELAVAGQRDAQLISGQADRVVVAWRAETAVAADIVDYKTDQIDSDRADQLDQRVQHYKPQLDAYRHAIASMLQLDIESVTASLAFVRSGIVKTTSASVSA